MARPKAADYRGIGLRHEHASPRDRAWGAARRARISCLPAGPPEAKDQDSSGEGAEDFSPLEFGPIERPLRRAGPREAGAQVQPDKPVAGEAALAGSRVSGPGNEGAISQKLP